MTDVKHDPLKRFLRKVRANEHGCWVWTAGLYGRTGYAQFWDGERKTTGHRFAFETFRGEVPEGLVLDHIVCDRRDCVNPWHLRIATQQENILRGNSFGAQRARQVTCLRGHSLVDPENVYNPPEGGRSCRTCNRERQRVTRLKGATLS